MKKNVLNSLYNNIIYHNQFILGPSYVEKLKSWKRFAINGLLYITAHPDLNIINATRYGKSVTLIGFILDPYNPEDDDQNIIDKLTNTLEDCESFIKKTYRFGGRWILIVNDGKKLILFNDTAGLRQVFYTDTSQNKDLWCASQSGILAEILKLGMNERAVEFIKSFYKKDKEYWLPGDSSPHDGIKHLLPNNYLDLETGRYFRYWPDKSINKISLNKGAKKSAKIIKGIMKSASNRYDLAIAMTAGWDSRLVLASSIGIKNNISYHTTKQPDMSDDHPDLTIPTLILSQFSLKHEVLAKTPEL